MNEARRELAKRSHPDVGGTVEAMQRVNDAAAAALHQLAAAAPPSDGPVDLRRRRDGGNASRRRDDAPTGRAGVQHDHPSFTVEALPVDTFEGLLVVASWLGDLVVDEPPYQLEVMLSDPLGAWCRLDIVPDAGSSTVSLVVAAEPGAPVPDIDAVRDAWIEGLNQLDWEHLDIGHPGPPPS